MSNYLMVVVNSFVCNVYFKLEMYHKVCLEWYWCFWVFAFLALQSYEVFADDEPMWHCRCYAILALYYFVPTFSVFNTFIEILGWFSKLWFRSYWVWVFLFSDVLFEQNDPVNTFFKFHLCGNDNFQQLQSISSLFCRRIG